MGKGNESVNMVGCANENEGGGSIEGISSLLSGSVDLTQNMGIYKEQKRKQWAPINEFCYPSSVIIYLQNNTEKKQGGVVPSFQIRCISQYINWQSNGIVELLESNRVTVPLFIKKNILLESAACLLWK